LAIIVAVLEDVTLDHWSVTEEVVEPIAGSIRTVWRWGRPRLLWNGMNWLVSFGHSQCVGSENQ